MPALPIALTQAQWFTKLKGFVPSWVFEREVYAKAHFMALAKILSQTQQEMYDHFDQSYIENADGEVLDLHGSERNTGRLPAEMDSSYQLRIRNIVNFANLPALKSIVDGVLVAGPSIFLEDYNAPVFFDRELFFNRDQLLLSEIIKDAFTILVPKQVHVPYSFFDRENFLDREDFLGASESLDSVFQTILEAVNKAKAAGVLYRIIELLEE